MLGLRNRLYPLFRAASPSPLPSPFHRHACCLFSTSTSTSTSTSLSPSPAAFSLEDYLVAACGLAPAQARKVSKKAFTELSRVSRRPWEELSYCRLISASNPDAVLALLSSAGLSRDDIAAVISVDPLLLRATVKNIGPRLLALRDRLGLSAPQIARFLLVGSRALRDCDVVPKLEFFISSFGSFDKVLKVAKQSTRFLTASLDRVIEPNIALFHQCGIRDIPQLCSNSSRVLAFNPERVKEFLVRAEELGVPPISRNFKHAVAVVSRVSSKKVVARIEFLKRTLGCSEHEVSVAVSKVPNLLGFSDDNLRRKIEFLVNEAAMEPQYIVQRPILLTFSVEKRLLPRYYVMKVLQEKGLLSSKMTLFTFANKFGEEDFKSKFIDCHKDSVPGLAHAYAAARAGIVPSGV